MKSLHDVAAFLVLVTLALIPTGCSTGEAEEKSLEGSVYASQIPVYSGAKYKDSFGGMGYDEIGGPPTSQSMSWFFELKDPTEKVIAFYAEKLPKAKRESTAQGEVFSFAPVGSEPTEFVWVTIRSGELQITESVKFGKRPE